MRSQEGDRIMVRFDVQRIVAVGCAVDAGRIQFGHLSAGHRERLPVVALVAKRPNDDRRVVAVAFEKFAHQPRYKAA